MEILSDGVRTVLNLQPTFSAAAAEGKGAISSGSGT
jgi:hypothetical protein